MYPKDAIVGIGILVYHAIEEADRLIRSIEASTVQRHIICVRDNTDSGKTMDDWLQRYGPQFPNVVVLRDGRNVGCAVARNQIYAWFSKSYPAMKYMVILDQDMLVQSGWLDDMLEVAETKPNVGIVTWPMMNFSRQIPDADGAIIDCGGGACLHNMAAVKAVGGWDSRFFFYRFDSWFALYSFSKGYRTYLVTKYLPELFSWQTYVGKAHEIVDCVKIKHVHPHRGTARNPAQKAIRQASDQLYQQLVQEHNLTQYDRVVRGKWRCA